jgi:hypothetical protein
MRAAARSVWVVLGASLAIGCPPHDAPVETRRDASVQDASISVASSDAGVVDAAPPPLDTTEPPVPPAPAFDVEFTHRLRHLLDAIGTNDAALCHDVQLPRKAYVEDYAAKDLARTWDRGVDAQFKKSLGRLHRKQKHVELAFVSLEVPRAMEVVPAREHEGWRRPLWRVEHTRLHARPVAQAPGEVKDTLIEVGSLVYWRGAWYIERL